LRPPLLTGGTGQERTGPYPLQHIGTAFQGESEMPCGVYATFLVVALPA